MFTKMSLRHFLDVIEMSYVSFLDCLRRDVCHTGKLSCIVNEIH